MTDRNEDDAPVALITGASSGIGRAVAIGLARLGWRLALSARRAGPLEAAAAEATEAGAADAVALPADVGDLAQARALVRDTMKAFGRLDAIVNNAGCADLLSIDHTTDAALERAFFTNAIGPGAIISEAWPIFTRQKRGRIVNVSTIGTDDPFPGFFAYAASKAALNLYARSCANEGKSVGVKAFSVAPGAVETPMLRALFSEDFLPRDQTLAPDDVAQVVIDCIFDRRDAENGRTILLSKPAQAAS